MECHRATRSDENIVSSGPREIGKDEDGTAIPIVTVRTEKDYCDIYASELRDNFVLSDRLGRGAFGVVRLCISKDTEKEYAVKMVSKKALKKKAGFSRRFPKSAPVKTPLDQVYAEITLLKKLNHPHIVKLFEVYDDDSSDDLCMVFEYLQGGPIMAELPTTNLMGEKKARKYFVHTFLAMEYLHHQKIIHRDIKPENILLDANDNAKLVDLGESIEFQGDVDSISGTKGTPGFLAPELVDLENQENCRGIPVDIWALGITLYALLFGDIPFNGDGRMQLYENIAKQKLVIPEQPKISTNAHHLLQRMLDKNPKTRISTCEMRIHAWLKELEGEIPSKEVNEGSVVDISEEEIESTRSSLGAINISTIAMIKSMLMKRRSLRSSTVAATAASGETVGGGGNQLSLLVASLNVKTHSDK